MIIVTGEEGEEGSKWRRRIKSCATGRSTFTVNLIEKNCEKRKINSMRAKKTEKKTKLHSWEAHNNKGGAKGR